MSDWTNGYTSEVTYTYGYYGELNPLRIRLAFLDAGLDFPEVGAACELGFGQGISVNLHAAASVVQWCGTDFNPAQARFAQDLAASAHTGARLYEDAFAEFAQRQDLPDFDFMALHGIWSWISDDNRQVIVDLIRRKLKPGGVLYISYNTFPGWATFAPMRHLLSQHAEVMGSQGEGVLGRVDGALAFAEELLLADPAFVKANPSVSDRLKSLRKNNQQYLAHEYFNAHWKPMYFAEVQKSLDAAKLQFACSAHYPDHMDALNLTGPQQTFLKGLADANWRESVRDYMVNQQFRRDYWVKGARALAPFERLEKLRTVRVVLTSRREGLVLKFKGRLGEATPQGPIYDAVLDVLADQRVYTLGQLENQLANLPGSHLLKIKDVVVALVGAGHVSLAHEEEMVQRALLQTQRLNAQLMHLSRSSNDFNYLASPLTGGGIPVRRFHQLFLAAMAQGHKDAKALADSVWNVLQMQVQKIQKEGQTLESVEDNLMELQAQAQGFLEQQLPLLKTLRIA